MEDAKPEKFRALIDAVMKYGKYSDGPAAAPKYTLQPSGKVDFSKANMVTPRDVKKIDWDIPGYEEFIIINWEMSENMAYNWLLSW